MKFPVIIDDFSRGEVSPLALARLSSAEVKNGVAECINMIPDPHGPLIGRQGFKHLADIPATALYCTMFEFEMYEGKTLVILFYDDEYAIYNLSAGVMTTNTGSTPYSDLLLHGASHDQINLEGVPSPDGTKIYFLHGSVAPYSMEIADLATPADDEVDITFGAVSFTDKPSEWTGDNYPTTMAFFQDRAWFSGTKLNPESLWGSKSGAANHTVLTTGTLDDDAVNFSLQRKGFIKWLSGHSTLLIGSSWGEFIASGSADVITPSDVQIDPQSAYGSKRLQPEFIGDEVLYVSTDGKKLRSMWWRWVESGWKSIDLTFTADHIPARGIKDLAYCRDPDSLIWLLMQDSSLALCSFRRANDSEPVVGFAQAQVSERIGDVVAICAAKESGVSSLVIAAQVEVDGVAKLHLMRHDAKNIYVDDPVFLDNYSEHELSVGVTTVSDLDHLEGETVSIVGDGAVLQQQTVVAGEIELGLHYDKVYVGHAYDKSFTTLPFFIYEKQLAHPMKRFNKIWCYILNSFPPLINGKRVPTRYPGNVMGQGVDPITGMVMVSNVGWDREAKITILQDVPKPLIVLGIYGEANFETV